MGSSSPNRVENKKYLKPPPRKVTNCHQVFSFTAHERVVQPNVGVLKNPRAAFFFANPSKVIGENPWVTIYHRDDVPKKNMQSWTSKWNFPYWNHPNFDSRKQLPKSPNPPQGKLLGRLITVELLPSLANKLQPVCTWLIYPLTTQLISHKEN